MAWSLSMGGQGPPAGQQHVDQGQAFAQRQVLQHLAAMEPSLENAENAQGIQQSQDMVLTCTVSLDR